VVRLVQKGRELLLAGEERGRVGNDRLKYDDAG